MMDEEASLRLIGSAIDKENGIKLGRQTEGEVDYEFLVYHRKSN